MKPFLKRSLGMNYSLEVFYDGECPLCRREINWLRKKDPMNRICFTDLAGERFDASSVGKSYAELMDRIHGRLSDGTWLEGVELFIELYRLTGLTWMSKLLAFPLLKPLFKASYKFFARYRLSLTGRKRCDISCKQGAPS